MDGYKTYDTSQGYGNREQWKDAFNYRMGYEEAEKILSEDDPYIILGISSAATFKEIKKAYRKMSMKWHPDKNQDVDTTEKMQKIVAAYTILKKKFGEK